MISYEATMVAEMKTNFTHREGRSHFSGMLPNVLTIRHLFFLTSIRGENEGENDSKIICLHQ